MRKALPFAVASALSVLAGTASLGAIIEPVGGDLSINRQGKGFQIISETTIVSPGDLVMVSFYGSANVFYPDGCKIVLQPGAVMAIGPLSPCAAGANAQAAGPDNPPFGSFGESTFTAAAVGVSGFLAYEIYQAHKTNTPASQPASP